MIKPNELRVGNFVQCKKHNGEEYITDIGSVGHWGCDGACTHDGEIEGEECWPIPLTAEWLERMGFVRERGYYKAFYFDPNMVEYLDAGPYQNADGTEVVHLRDPSLNRKGRPIRYVHELQNLYFALTGEELTIK